MHKSRRMYSSARGHTQVGERRTYVPATSLYSENYPNRFPIKFELVSLKQAGRILARSGYD
jgi:hypothetical protein